MMQAEEMTNLTAFSTCSECAANREVRHWLAGSLLTQVRAMPGPQSFIPSSVDSRWLVMLVVQLCLKSKLLLTTNITNNYSDSHNCTSSTIAHIS